MIRSQIRSQGTRRFIGLGLVIVLGVTMFGDDADAKRRKRRARKKNRQPIINEKKLYERLGGQKSVGAIVDEWVRMNLADPRVASSFSPASSAPEKLARWRKGMHDQICEWAEGPCQAKGVDGELKKTQEALALDEARFLAFSDNLFKTLDKSGVPEREKNELLGRLGEYRNDLLPEEEGG